jgi:hypothetical protein
MSNIILVGKVLNRRCLENDIQILKQQPKKTLESLKLDEIERMELILS